MKECAICLESVPEMASGANVINFECKLVQLPKCKHKFHTTCFLEYVTYQFNHNPCTDVRCPECRDRFIQWDIQNNTTIWVGNGSSAPFEQEITNEGSTVTANEVSLVMTTLKVFGLITFLMMYGWVAWIAFNES